jgi:hypothetical protein
MGNSEDRDPPLGIVNSEYDSMARQTNTIVIFALGQFTGFCTPWIHRQGGDLPEDATAIGLGSDRLIFPEDGCFQKKLITFHADADQRQMIGTR